MKCNYSSFEPVPLDIVAVVDVRPPLLLVNPRDVADPRLARLRWCDIRSDPEMPPGHCSLVIGHSAVRWRAEHP